MNMNQNQEHLEYTHLLLDPSTNRRKQTCTHHRGGAHHQDMSRSMYRQDMQVVMEVAR